MRRRGSIEKISRGVIISGPFAGIRYADSDAVGISIPYILGTYELELGPVIESLCQKPFDTIVNAGAGKGYYAVGFAIKNPLSRIIAFESDIRGRECIAKMARLNAVADRVAVKGTCDTALLADSVSGRGRCLVIMDVEGGEGVLLDPVVIPRLKECHILVELHDFIFRGIAEVISARFQASHDIAEIWSRPRTLDDFPVKTSLLTSLVLKRRFVGYMDERRPEKMRWFYLKPKGTG